MPVLGPNIALGAHARAKGAGGAIAATAIRQRNTDVIRDRAGNTIQVRS